jgi:hypothetical protein
VEQQRVARPAPDRIRGCLGRNYVGRTGHMAGLVPPVPSPLERPDQSDLGCRGQRRGSGGLARWWQMLRSRIRIIPASGLDLGHLRFPPPFIDWRLQGRQRDARPPGRHPGMHILLVIQEPNCAAFPIYSNRD